MLTANATAVRDTVLAAVETHYATSVKYLGRKDAVASEARRESAQLAFDAVSGADASPEVEAAARTLVDALTEASAADNICDINAFGWKVRFTLGARTGIDGFHQVLLG